MSQPVTLVLPASAEYVVVARLTASGIGSRSLPSMADLEDLKLAVAEACNLLISLQATSLALEFSPLAEGLAVKVVGEGCTQPVPAADSEEGLPLMLMEAVVDELKIDSAPGRVELCLTLNRSGQTE